MSLCLKKFQEHFAELIEPVFFLCHGFGYLHHSIACSATKNASPQNRGEAAASRYHPDYPEIRYLSHRISGMNRAAHHGLLRSGCDSFQPRGLHRLPSRLGLSKSLVSSLHCVFSYLFYHSFSVCQWVFPLNQHAVCLSSKHELSQTGKCLFQHRSGQCYIHPNMTIAAKFPAVLPSNTHIAALHQQLVQSDAVLLTPAGTV